MSINRAVPITARTRGGAMRALMVVVAILMFPASAAACEDTQGPVAPQVTRVDAVAGTQALVEWSDTPDLGCSGVSHSAVTLYDGPNAVGTTAVDVHGLRNGSDHEALTAPWLQAGRTYMARAVAVDKAGNFTEGNATTIRTPDNYNTVIAGQAKMAGTPGIHGVVSGLLVGASGQGSAQTITDARGMYRLSVPAFSNGVPYSLTYGPGCGGFLPSAYCATGWATPSITDGITLGLDGSGRVFVKNKTL